MSEIQTFVFSIFRHNTYKTISFRFRMFGLSSSHRSETKLDHFIYNFFLDLKRSSLVLRPKSKLKSSDFGQKITFEIRTFAFRHSTVVSKKYLIGKKLKIWFEKYICFRLLPKVLFGWHTDSVQFWRPNICREIFLKCWIFATLDQKATLPFQVIRSTQIVRWIFTFSF